jgi:hypothetical protein
MATAETPQPEAASSGRRWAWPALGVVLAGGLALRLWGVGEGLPFVYNADEHDHFVAHAVAMFEHHTLNPHYFANPPAFTYLLHFLFAVYFGSAHAVEHALATHPTELYTLARVASAVLGTISLWLVYLVGARLFSRAIGLLAAAIEAVAFLPVFYAHLALNDVPTLAPLTLSLLGSAGVLRKGRLRDHVLAGAGLGFACATKYTAGIVLLPYGAALAWSYLDSERGAGRRILLGALSAGAMALLAFLIANPYAVLDYSAFHRELVHQSTLSAEAQGKLGAPREGGFLYYLWVLTWGLGWAPALCALGGSLAVWRHERRLGWMLVPAALLFLLFMGTQGRYFGRWLMPVLPILCLLGAFFVVWLASIILPLGREQDQGPEQGVRSRGFVPSLLLGSLLVTGVLIQGIAHSVHSGIVLSREDTRGLTRTWMLANIPRGAKIVVEPNAPNNWVEERPGAPQCKGNYRWCKYPSLFFRVSASGKLLANNEHGPEAGLENYVRTLAPSLINYYVDHEYCWVITGSTQRDRAFADPSAVPLAVAYYRTLARRASIAYRISPYGKHSRRVPFNFDWSFDYYPLAYRLPGPVMTVYHLRGGTCGR